ncbi:MAG: hypothetical protein DRJ05_06715 [Bacteroidetes bacterium]|nr:MAG: hypothetical protein DRJ05_06715 [Bacteroidota bacterium]
MKKLVLFTLAIGFALTGMAQERAYTSQQIRDIQVKKTKAIKDGSTQQSNVVPGTKTSNLLEADDIGSTWYDNQSNRSVQNRLFLYEDGTIGGTWTRGPEGAPSGADRGTAYNYFDGNSWGEWPTERLEDTKTGWPTYTDYGENGELFVCHHMTLGLLYGTREEKGTGEWQIEIQGGPSGVEDISWPRGITSGDNNEFIHFLSVTFSNYQGQENALLYSRSSDGGASWEIENYLFDELGFSEYENMGADIYEFAEPNAGLLAFLVGDNWTDLVLMKSEDNGDNWDKTKIWECPYPQGGANADTFYCPDGSHDIAIDNNGKVHVVFGISRSISDAEGAQSYYPGVDGIGYWNEDMPMFSNDLHALDPYGHPDSELVDNETLIGWSQDIDGDGVVTILDELAPYNTGLSSQPQIVIDDMDDLYVVYSSVTETFDNSVSNFRHIWARASHDNGNSWGGFSDLNSDLAYIFDECVFPSVAKNSDENIYYSYQADDIPGTTTEASTENFYRVVKVLKSDVWITGVEEMDVINTQNVSQNYPNPFNGTSSVYVTLQEAAPLSLEIHNMIGQLISVTPERIYQAGKQEIRIDAQNLEAGIYFYTVISNETKLTQKMIVN